MRPRHILIGIILTIAPLLVASAEEPLRLEAPAGIDQPWLDQAAAFVTRSEYLPSASADGTLQAPNRAQGFRARFAAEGVLLAPRRDGGAGPLLSLRLAAAGRRGAAALVAQAAPRAEGARVEYARPRGLIEWYENGEHGLEQGFLWPSPPPGEGELVLQVAVESNLEARPAADRIEFLDGAGRAVLAYSQLEVRDARGARVAARMQWTDGAIELIIDDRGAVAPLLVDPLLTGPGWSAEGNEQDSEFGLAVSTAGDVDGDGYAEVAIGAPRFDGGQADQGRVFVFQGSAKGLSAQPAWIRGGEQMGARFGHALAAAGDVDGDGFADLLVGAPEHDHGEMNEGRVFLFRGSSTGPEASASWIAELNQAGARLGVSVASAGDVDGDGYSDVLAGSDRQNNHAGRVHLWRGGPTGPAALPDWIADGSQPDANLGASVAAAGDVDGDGFADVLAGAPGQGAAPLGAGRAVVYRGGAGGPSAAAFWTYDGTQENGRLGFSVAPAGDVNGDGFADVLAGAPGESTSYPGEGRAHGFHGSPAGPSAAPDWTGTGGSVGAAFGRSVYTAGDVNGDGLADVLIGAPFHSGAHAFEGRAALYPGSQAGLAPEAAWSVHGDAPSAWLGLAVAPAGDVNGDGFGDILIGTASHGGSPASEGGALVFHGAPAGPAQSSTWSFSGAENGEQLGLTVAAAGDLDGDGFGDVLVGAPGFDGGLVDQGRILFFRGAQTGPATSPDWWAAGGQAGARLGAALAAAGDVDGDGFIDLLAGAPGFDGAAGADAGRAFLYRGALAGPSAPAAWLQEGDQAGARLGEAVASAGDVDGDGYADVLIGAPGRNGAAGAAAGQVRLHRGGSGGLESLPWWSADGIEAGSGFGSALACAGDANGDGWSDFLASAPAWSGALPLQGRADLYYGSATSAPALGWTAAGSSPGAALGARAAGAGDVDGDGFQDVALAAPGDGAGGPLGGQVRLHLGSSSGPGAAPDWTWSPGTPAAEAGRGLAGAGDVDGDGRADLIVGLSAAGGTAAILFSGTDTGLTADPVWAAAALPGLSGQEAWSVDSAGDVNGDGCADLLLGLPDGSGGSPSRGRALVVHGNFGAGATLVARQRRLDGGAPVAPLGPAEDGLLLLARGRSPFGRGPVRLEWQACAPGQTFGAAAAYGPWLDSGVAGVDLAGALEGLAPGRHAWRLRLRPSPRAFPLAAAGPWRSVPRDAHMSPNVTVVPALSDLVLGDASSMEVQFVLGGPLPGERTRSLANAGAAGSSLDWTVQVAPPSPWLAVLPAAGGGLLAGAPPALVAFQFDPALAAVGANVATVRFVNGSDPEDTESLVVLLQVDQAQPKLAVAPAGLVSFQHVLGTPFPAPLKLAVANAGEPYSTLAWSAALSAPASWLGVAPLSGALVNGGAGSTASEDVWLTVQPAGLAPGTHATTLAFTAAGSAGAIDVPVELVVVRPPADLCLSDGSPLDLTFTLGGAPPAPIARFVQNCGPPDSRLDWSAAAVLPAAWLVVDPPAAEDLPGGAAQAASVRVEPAGLAAGAYAATLRFANDAAPGDVEYVPVSLTVLFGPGVLCVGGPQSVNVEYVLGSAAPAPVSFTLKNCGPDPSALDWTAGVLSGGFASLSPGAGAALLAGEEQPVALLLDPTGLSPGMHSALARFQNSDVPVEEVVVPVTLHVVEPPADLVLEDSAELTVSHVVGQAAPAPLTVHVLNAGSPLSTLHAGAIPSPSVSWLALAPPNAVIPGQESRPFGLTLQPNGLPDGDYPAMVRFENALDPADHADLTVRLLIGNPVFRPGDRLLAQFSGAGGAAEAGFDGLERMRLRLSFLPGGGQRTLVSLLDPSAQAVESWLVEHGAKTVKRSAKLPVTGRYTLRIQVVEGPSGVVEIKTGRTLPRAARARVRRHIGPEADGFAKLPVLALPEASLDLTARPGKHFAGPLHLGIEDPGGAELDASGFLETLASGALRVTGLPLAQGGRYALRVGGFGAPSARARITLRPRQPPEGEGVLVLPVIVP
ncbi:MAG: FG-GAP repeat protein [Planctomycetes bacterium]|nr:FG-GAP repeat protein [Planctomycetota bacterium]